MGLIKETANLELSKKEQSEKATRGLVTAAFIAGKETEQLVSFITNRNYGLEFWGGVGVQCIDWNPQEPNVIAAVTLKTNQLEVWKVDTAEMLALMYIDKKLATIQWSPHDPNRIIGRVLDKNGFMVIDY